MNQGERPVFHGQDNVSGVAYTPFSGPSSGAMIGLQPKPTIVGDDDVLTLLRKAWRHTQAASDALEQARKYDTVNDLRHAFVMQATERVEQSRAAIEEAGKLLRG